MKFLISFAIVILVGSAAIAQVPVVINEFMASNLGTVADPAGDFDDWIELYNTSNFPVDISGYFISDDGTNLTKWELPEGSVIVQDNYFIIWADEDGDQMQEGLHANFKLAKAGEEIYFSTPDSVVVDFIIYGQQETDKSYAREPNGSGDFVIKGATFDENNDLVSNTKDELFLTNNLKVFPNPTSDNLNIQFDNHSNEEMLLAIYNLCGQLLHSQVIVESVSISTKDYGNGIYFAKLGNTQFKFIVKN